MNKQKLLNKKRKAIEEKNEAALCVACTDLANFYMKQENFYEAISEYEILAKVYKKQKRVLDIATINRGIGEAYMLLTNYEKALEYQKIYLELSKEQKNKLEEQRALATLGHTYLTKYIADKQNRNDLIMAHKYTMQSLEVSESLTDIKKYDLVDITARLYNNLGVIHEYQGHHDKSQELFNKTIVLCKANDVYHSLQQAYNSLASLFERRGEYNGAIRNYNLAIEAARKLKDNVSPLYDCLASKATILLKLGDLKAAEKSLYKAYKLKLTDNTKEDVGKKLKTVVKLYRKEKEMLSKSYTDTELQIFYEKMGDGFSTLHCFDKALEYYHKMLEIAERTKTNLSSCYYSMAATYRDDEQYDKAVEFFEKEYLQCDFKKGLDTLCEIADTKESGGCTPCDIIQVYERAINRCREAKSKREEGRMLGRLVNYLERTGNSDRLLEYKRRFDESGFESSDSEELTTQESHSEEEISLDNLTDDSEESESDSPSKKRRSKTFQVRRNLRGETQLHTACIAGKTNVVTHLLEQGHPINIRDNGGWLPLHDACISGHYDIVQILLVKGASVNDRGGTHCNGTTPLHDAAVNGHLEIMELLLDRGASALAKTDEGETPYHYLKKTCLDVHFDDDRKVLCEKLLERMSAILDKAGQSKEINTNIRNKAFVSEQRDQLEQSSRRRSAPETSNARVSIQERRLSYSRSLNGSSSSEEDIDEFEVSEKSMPKTQATNEYKMVMDSLRKKHCEVTDFRKEGQASFKRPAYIMEEDNPDDDWLEDDMRTTKKRKLGFTDGLINSSKTRSISSPMKRCNSIETVSSKSSKSSHISSGRPNSRQRLNSKESENMDDVIRTIDNVNTMDKLLPDPISIGDDSDDDFTELLDSRRKQQSSLLDAGFIRCTTSSDISRGRGNFSQKRSIQPKITHFGSTTPTKVTQNSSHRSSSSPQKWSQPSPSKSLLIDDDPMLAMDVNIEHRPFRVTTRMSMKDTLTVKWLALEAARRYAKKEYVEPVLELTTQSGAELVDDDTIGTLFITNCQVVEVNAKVLKWNLPPIQERYKEACSDMNTKPLDSICLKLDTLTISLDMKNAGLHPASMAPLCKSLLRENRLLELDLSNNFLSLDCIKLLTASLQTLENLTKLNLCCTNLHVEGVRFLSNAFSNSPVNILTKMYSLNLSENFIGDESLQDIATLTRHLNLKDLNLSFLDFTEDVFKKSYNRNTSFDLSSIEHLYLSGNNFGSAALTEILSFVNGNRLSSLDVGYNKASEGFLTSLIDCLSKKVTKFNFEYLNLSRCPVTDAEVFSLLRYCDNLKTINLSYTSITSLTLRRTLESKFIKNIIILGCPNIDKYFEDIDLWILTDYLDEQKSLKITCDRDKSNILIRLWNMRYSDKVTMDIMGNLLILK